MGSIPGMGDPLEEGLATHSSILAWKTPWTEEPGGLQCLGFQTVGHDRSNLALDIFQKYFTTLLKALGHEHPAYLDFSQSRELLYQNL